MDRTELEARAFLAKQAWRQRYEGARNQAERLYGNGLIQFDVNPAVSLRGDHALVQAWVRVPLPKE